MCYVYVTHSGPPLPAKWSVGYGGTPARGVCNQDHQVYCQLQFELDYHPDMVAVSLLLYSPGHTTSSLYASSLPEIIREYTQGLKPFIHRAHASVTVMQRAYPQRCRRNSAVITAACIAMAMLGTRHHSHHFLFDTYSLTWHHTQGVECLFFTTQMLWQHAQHSYMATPCPRLAHPLCTGR